jgi:hypothetical protein
MPLASLTRTQRFALRLFSCNLKTPEVAHAMGWTIPETQTFRAQLMAALRVASASPNPCQKVAEIELRSKLNSAR